MALEGKAEFRKLTAESLEEKRRDILFRAVSSEAGCGSSGGKAKELEW